MTNNQSANGEASEADLLKFGNQPVPRRTILGPGPSSASPRVLRAMSQPIIGYLDPAFFTILDEVSALLDHVFITNQTTMVVAGAGSAGMEAGLSSLLERGDKAIICVNGFFCERQILMCERLGIEVVRVESPYGKPVDPQMLEDALVANPDAKLVSAIHAETSAGVLQDINTLSALAHDHDALFMTDVVTSLAGTQVEFDAWEVDYAYGGSQKCLAAPPGISPVAISDRALDHIRNRKTLPSSWYLDLDLIANYWGPEHVHHHTSPVSMIYGLREALMLVAEEGLQTRWTRHEKVAQALRAGTFGLAPRFAGGRSKPSKPANGRIVARSGERPRTPIRIAKRILDRSRPRTRPVRRQSHPYRPHGRILCPRKRLRTSQRSGNTSCPEWATKCREAKP